MLLHRKNDSRDASSTSLTRWIEPGVAAAVLLDAEDEGRAGENAPQRQLNAGVEAPFLRPAW